MNVNMKQCCYCHKMKTIDQFYIDKRGIYSARCTFCHGLATRQCRICGVAFVGSAGTKVCSPQCKAQLRPQTYLKCEWCPCDRDCKTPQSWMVGPK
jgi:hypothetical protein